MAVVLAIGAALGFGTADFIGGLKSRRHPLPLVLAISQGTALVVVSIALIATRQPLASIEGAGIGFLSGVFSLLGLAVYYRGLAIGAMGVVGPIAATAVVIPLSVGLISGDQLSAFQVAGIALAIMGIVGLAYRPTTGASGHRVAVGVGLGVLAALGIGIYYSLIDAAAASATVLWVVFFNRLGAVVTITALVYPFSARVGLHRPERPRVELSLPDTGWLVTMGVIAVTSIGLLAAATTQGALSIVSVLAATFPVTTILLARLVLGERLGAVQRVGAVVALAGVALIAL